MKIFQLELSHGNGIYVILHWLLNGSLSIMLTMQQLTIVGWNDSGEKDCQQENEVNEVSEGLDSANQHDCWRIELSRVRSHSMRESLETDDESDRIHRSAITPLLHAFFDIL